MDGAGGVAGAGGGDAGRDVLGSRRGAAGGVTGAGGGAGAGSSGSGRSTGTVTRGGGGGVSSVAGGGGTRAWSFAHPTAAPVVSTSAIDAERARNTMAL